MNTNMSNENNINNRKNILNRKTKASLLEKQPEDYIQLHPHTPPKPWPFWLLPEEQLTTWEEHRDINIQKKKNKNVGNIANTKGSYPRNG